MSDLIQAEIPMAEGGAAQSYVALPPSGRGPGILLLTPIFGATAGMQEFAGRIAAEGFVVAVPDMFWRTTPGPLGYDGTDRELAQERYKQFDVEEGVGDLAHMIAWLRATLWVTGEIGVVGVCFGGRYAFLAAARLGVAAAISYHGTLIEKHLDECPAIGCPTSLHFGENDKLVPMDTIERIRHASCTNPDIGVFTYAGAPHGFMQQDRPSYDPTAATAALARGLDLLKSALIRGE